AARLAHERPGQTLQATALVHEAYLRLVNVQQAQRWDSAGHFFAAAAEAMRRIVVERARKRASVMHGGQMQRLGLDQTVLALSTLSSDSDLESLDRALTELEQHDEAAARLVKLRYFAGLSHQDAAQAMGLTRRAADRLWAVARAWLYQRLRESA